MVDAVDNETDAPALMFRDKYTARLLAPSRRQAEVLLEVDDWNCVSSQTGDSLNRWRSARDRSDLAHLCVLSHVGDR